MEKLIFLKGKQKRNELIKRTKICSSFQFKELYLVIALDRIFLLI